MTAPARQDALPSPHAEIKLDATICCGCGSHEIVAVRPGSEADRALDQFVVRREKPMRAWCAVCWPWCERVVTHRESDALAIGCRP